MKEGEKNIGNPEALVNSGFFNKRFSRREVLMGAGILAAGAVLGAKEAESYFFGEQNYVWKKAAQENQDFLEENRENLSHIKFGASFSPEMFDLSSEDITLNPFEFERKRMRMLEGLDTVIHDFGITDIRLGIRWDNAIINDKVSLLFYDPIIRKCLDSGVNITLNCGAIKTFRWPEEHVPRKLLNSISVPPKRGIITVDDELAKHAAGYLENLFGLMEKEYGNDLNKITTVQPENEGWNPFGKEKWTVNNDYYKKKVDIIHAYFPNASILVNSSGGEHLSNIRQLFGQIERSNPDLRGKMHSGIDFYFDTPSKIHLPNIHPAIDPITASNIRNPFSTNEFDRHMKEAREMGIITEITEGQTEKYNEITHPQEKAQSFRFWVLRTAPYTDGLQRIWGIEEFAKRAVDGGLTDENRKVIELVQSVNGA